MNSPYSYLQLNHRNVNNRNKKILTNISIIANKKAIDVENNSLSINDYIKDMKKIIFYKKTQTWIGVKVKFIPYKEIDDLKLHINI